MPEIWIPFGGVESLVTIQAENLGQVVEPEPPSQQPDLGRFIDSSKSSASLFVCDAAPSTVELLRGASQDLIANPSLKLFSAAPKRVESHVPDLKGRILTLPPPMPQQGNVEPIFAPELIGPGRKVFVGTARPDPLFGIVDAKVEACMNWVAGSMRSSAEAREDMEPSPFQKSDSFGEVESLAEKIGEATFFSAIPKGGRLAAVMEDPPFDAVKNGFAESGVGPSRAMVAGAGGRGFDDSLSSALRGVWGALPGLRKSGSLLLVAECSEGLGSTALEMLATGRLTREGTRKKDSYVSGLEEIHYLNKLKQEYDVLLLSGLPETYARGKLGLTTAGGSGEAVGRLLNKAGRTGKVNVVTRMNECRLVPS